MTTRELDLARKAAAKYLAQPDPPKPDKPVKRKRRSPRALGCTLPEIKAKFQAANDAYEARKSQGAKVATIEREFGLNPNSLKGWRSRRMISGDTAINRIYVNRPLKTRP